MEALPVGLAFYAGAPSGTAVLSGRTQTRPGPELFDPDFFFDPFFFSDPARPGFPDPDIFLTRPGPELFDPDFFFDPFFFSDPARPGFPDPDIFLTRPGPEFLTRNF